MTPAERTEYNVRYAVKRRHDLIRTLSPELRCAICHEVHPLEQLDLDHVDGRTWKVESMSSSTRAARYWREFRAGVRLRVLCHVCGAVEGGGRRYDVDRD